MAPSSASRSRPDLGDHPGGSIFGLAITPRSRRPPWWLHLQHRGDLPRSRRPPWWFRPRHRGHLPAQGDHPGGSVFGIAIGSPVTPPCPPPTSARLGRPGSRLRRVSDLWHDFRTMGRWSPRRTSGRLGAAAIGSAARQRRTPAGGVGASATGPKHSSTPDHMPPSYCTERKSLRT